MKNNGMERAMRARIGLCIVGLSLFVFPLSIEAAKAPKWLEPLLRVEVEESLQSKGAVVLLDEALYDYDESGSVLSEVRWAIRIFDKSERHNAMMRVSYEEGHSHVTDFAAWMVDPQGKVYKYGKKDAYDMASDVSDLHSKMLEKVIDQTDDVRDGCVFAYEYTLRKKTIFSQLAWTLSQPYPVLKSKLSVIGPMGWSAKATYLNDPRVKEYKTDNAFVWEARDLEPVEGERLGPRRPAYAKVLGIDLRPGDDSRSSALLTFRDWAEIAAYDAEINDSQIEPDDAIRSKVEELIEGKESQWEQMAAIAAYAQSVNYVSIATDLAIGGGYVPFKATEVFSRHFGDCKDKTALMRSMLSCIGKESFSVSADIGPSAHVDPSWPSLMQFNHCIVAIPVGEDVDRAAVVEDEALGRLLLFDPTNQYVSFGLTPPSMRGGKVLVGSDAAQGLTEVPPLEPEDNLRLREQVLKLSATGAVTGTLESTYSGIFAISARSAKKRYSESEFEEMLSEMVSASGASSKVTGYEYDDDYETNRNTLTIDFHSPAFARSMRGKFLVVKPFALWQRKEIEKSENERKLPVVLEPRLQKEVVEIEPPEGFVVDDHMEAVRLETDFCSYLAKVEEVDGKLVCIRELRQKSIAMPANRYDEVVDFYEKVARAEQTPIVLARQ